MTLSLQCKNCHHVLYETVSLGYNLGTVLKAHGWIATSGGFYCASCSGNMPLADYAGMLAGDEICQN